MEEGKERERIDRGSKGRGETERRETGGEENGMERTERDKHIHPYANMYYFTASAIAPTYASPPYGFETLKTKVEISSADSRPHRHNIWDSTNMHVSRICPLLNVEYRFS